MFCLNSNITKDFLKRLKSGEIDPQKLSEMASAERRASLAKFMGEENARQANQLFESKLLLKNQQQGMINWAKQLAGMKPESKRDIISRIEKMSEILTPESEKAFLADLAGHKLGTSVTMKEASSIAELAKATSEKKALINPESKIGSPDRMEYGRSLVKFGNYVSDLKNQAKRLTLEDFKSNPGKSTLQSASNLAGLAKSVKASLDDSVIGRQGMKVLFSHPKIWLKNSIKTFEDIVGTFGGKNTIDEVRAEVLSRPNALNGLYKKEGLAIGTVEEAYPTSLPEKLPVVGRAFKASESAFTGFQYRTRADIFDKYVEIAEKTGADIEGIGKLANSLTGRGTFGQRGESMATVTNNVFFSPRFLKSNIDLLTAHATDSGISPFARKQAAINTLKVISGISAVLATSDAISPGSVEKDSRSSDFGKIKSGNTRFSVDGGMGSLFVLGSRLIDGHKKSSTTGKITELNTGKYNSETKLDQVYNFFEGKLSPAASVLKDLLKGRDFEGNKPTVAGEAKNLLMPLPITNFQELQKDPDSANILVALLADAFGIGTNTYSKKSFKKNGKSNV